MIKQEKLEIMKITKETFEPAKIKKNANIPEIQNLCEKYKNELMIVIGIGGSFLGAKAVIDALKPKYDEDKVVFIGDNLSSREWEDTLSLLANKDFNVNVVSKSGSTLETCITFHLIKELLNEKYGDNMHDRIIVSTDFNSSLHNEAIKNGWEILNINKYVGGRFSIFTPANLFPIAMAGFNINDFINGINLEETGSVFGNYVDHRIEGYTSNKEIEILAIYEPRLESLGKWWQQLYGESEGKKGQGLFPVYSVFPRDLHSLGQIIQEGKRNIIETMLTVDNPDLDFMINMDYLKSKGLNEITKIIHNGTKQAHEDGNVPTHTINLKTLNERELGSLMYSFMTSCIKTSEQLGINPYGQPGVEMYKQNIKNNLYL